MAYLMPNHYKTSASKIGDFYADGGTFLPSPTSSSYLALTGAGLHFKTNALDKVQLHATQERPAEPPSAAAGDDANGGEGA